MKKFAVGDQVIIKDHEDAGSYIRYKGSRGIVTKIKASDMYKDGRVLVTLEFVTCPVPGKVGKKIELYDFRLNKLYPEGSQNEDFLSLLKKSPMRE